MRKMKKMRMVDKNVSYHRDCRFRTEWNVTHSDATLIIARRPRCPYPDGELLEVGSLQRSVSAPTIGDQASSFSRATSHR